MSDGQELALVIGLLVLAGVVAGLGIWMNIAIIRRNRRIAREHPERVPYGPRLLLRGSPFVVLSVAIGVWGALEGQVYLAALGGLAVVLFAIEIWRRWEPPAGARGQSRA